jgi:cyclic-di-AMP phosphodiesterase PgpH
MIKPLLRLKRTIKRLLRVREDIDQVEAHRKRRVLVKYLMGITSVVLISFFYPWESINGPLDVPREGEISRESIIAEFSFSVLKDKHQLDDEMRQAALGTPVYIDHSEEIAHSNLSRVRQFLAEVDSLKKAGPALGRAIGRHIAAEYPFATKELLDRLEHAKSLAKLTDALSAILGDDIYYYGIVADTATLPPQYNSIVMDKKRRDLMMTRNQLIDPTGAYRILLAGLNELAPQTGIDVELAYDIGKNFIQPNAVYNEASTKVARDSVLAAISPVAATVSAGDLLIRRGMTVDARQARMLAAYAVESQRQTVARGWLAALLPLAGRVVMVGLLILFLFFFLYQFRPDVFWSNNKLLALLLIIGLELVLVSFVGVRILHSVYLYPIAILSILTTILFDSRLGVVITLLTALLLGLLNRFDFSLSIITALAGSVACFSAGEVRKRSAFYRIIFSLSLAYVIIAIAVESLRLVPTVDLLTAGGYGLINGFVSPMITIGILPVFESIFGFTTNVTLLELADLNQPILKRLSIEAPGTYHHSIIVGNLAEAAAKKISANPLLARVGAYYHDIGKIEIPEYFVENQLGIKSKHESLNPTMSALVLSSHVKRGRKMGEEAGLPDAVLNFVEEHHGTTMMTYFFNKAREMGLPIESENEFRYPGPKPQSRETAIVMLADSTEAASRTLDNPTPARIRNLIQRLINDKFGSGELTECTLTLRDLSEIREAFVAILIGVFHQRVAYPKKDDEEPG